MKTDRSQNIRVIVCTTLLLILQALNSTPVQAMKNDSTTVALRYRQLVDAENEHNAASVEEMLYASPAIMLVAKTKSDADDGWGGFWGKNTVGEQLRAIIYGGTFHLEPFYDKEKITFIKPDVAELYVPVNIAVSYAGQNPAPRRFIMIIIWIRTNENWLIQSDIVIPVPHQ